MIERPTIKLLKVYSVLLRICEAVVFVELAQLLETVKKFKIKFPFLTGEE